MQKMLEECMHFGFLRTADELIDFSSRQRNAIRKLCEMIQGKPECCGAFWRDVAQSGRELLLTERERALFFGELAGVYPLAVLLACVPDMAQEYRALGIPEEVLRDTLSDFRIWVQNCERRTGRIALTEYSWLTNHVRLEIFRLGRLQFRFVAYPPGLYILESKAGSRVFVASDDPVRSERPVGRRISSDGNASGDQEEFSPDSYRCLLAPGEPVLEVHIPEGDPLDPEAVGQSFRNAACFFQRYFPERVPKGAYTCKSWLLSPAWKEMGEGGNIEKFAARFRIVQLLDDRQMFERVFERQIARWEDMPECTSLQRNVKRWYSLSKTCPGALGVLLRPGERS